MKTSFHSIALVIAAGLLPPAWAQFDQTYYRLDGGNSGSLLNIGQMPPCGSVNPTPPPCSPWLNLPVYGSLNLHKNGTAPNNNVAVANIHSYLTGVSGGTYNSVQTVFTPFFADSVMPRRDRIFRYSAMAEASVRGTTIRSTRLWTVGAARR